MANIPKFSPKGRASLEKQVEEYTALMEKLMLENPAFAPKAPTILPGKSETVLDETVTRNPSATDPGGTNTKNSRTTTDAPRLIAPTAGEDAVRNRHNQLRAFIDQARIDLADETKLAKRIPMTTEEALDIASGQVSAMPESKRVKTFADSLGVKPMGSPVERAQDMLLRGATPNDGYTFLRSLLPGAGNDPRLLAEIMGQLNTQGGGFRVPFAQIQTDMGGLDLSQGGVRSGLERTAPGTPVDVGTAAARLEGDITQGAGAVPAYERGLTTLGEEAGGKIRAAKRNTLLGVLGAGVVAGGSRALGMWGGPDEADKFNADARKYLFGQGGPDTAAFSKEGGYGPALSGAFGSYMTREFGDEKSTKRAAYMQLVGKHQQTINRLGEGTLKPGDSDAGYKALTDDLGSFYSANYNEKAPLILPYGDGKKPGMIAINKEGKKFNRLKNIDFESIND